jgi:hypothetical protein
LTVRAEAVNPQALPAEVARREALWAKLDTACARLKAEACEQAAAAQPVNEAKKATYGAKTHLGDVAALVSLYAKRGRSVSRNCLALTFSENPSSRDFTRPAKSSLSRVLGFASVFMPKIENFTSSRIIPISQIYKG